MLCTTAQNPAQSRISLERLAKSSSRAYAALVASELTCAKASSDTSSAYAVELRAQSLNVDRKPCGTAFTSIRRHTSDILMSDNEPPRGDVNMNDDPSNLGIELRIAIAGSYSGTRWARPAFIRLPKIVHVAESRSTSSQVAKRTSPDRAAVRIKNSRARADMPSRMRS